NDTHMEAGGGVEGQTKRVVPRKIILPKGTLEFPDLDDFKNTVASEKLRSGVYSIGRKLPIIAHWTDRESSVTLVTFSAALTKNAAPSVPIFSGRRTTNGLRANVLMLSDPTLILSNKLMLGWYAGNSEIGGIQSKICKIIKRVSGQTQIILFGASGGGFAALDQTLRLPGAKALVINPQTDITKDPYYPRYRELVWRDPFADALDSELPIRTRVVEEYSKPVQTSVVYVQNTKDRHHYEHQMQPFREKLHVDNAVIFVNRDLGQGHYGPNAESMEKLFNHVTTIMDNSELAEKLDKIELVS